MNKKSNELNSLNNNIEIQDILNYFQHKHKGSFEKVYESLINKEKIENDDLIKVKKSSDKFISVVDFTNYALINESLIKIYKLPFIIYYKGNKELFHHNEIVISLLKDKSAETILDSLEASEFEEINNSTNNTLYLVDSFDWKLINYLIDKNKKMVVVCRTNIKQFRKSKSYKQINVNNFFKQKNILVISETPPTNSGELDDPDQNIERIHLSIAQKGKIAYFGNKNKEKLQSKINLFNKRESDFFGDIEYNTNKENCLTFINNHKKRMSLN